VSLLQEGKYALVFTTMLSKINPRLSPNWERLKQFLDSSKGHVVFGLEEINV
jgi:hypothetical protein